MCLYGDPAYPLRIHLQAPFRNAVLTPAMQAFNSSMSAVRESVEWLTFMDFHKNFKNWSKLCGENVYCQCSPSQCPYFALMEIKLQNILIWSPQPLKSILFRIPLSTIHVFFGSNQRVFNHMTSKCKKREGNVDYTVSF